jgi:hypothetical protein
MAVKSKRNPMLTRTGKPRLGPLNVKQLQDLLNKTQKKKDQSKIQRRITELMKRPGYKAPEVAVEAV